MSGAIVRSTDLAVEILADNKPLVFLDTAAILDIARAAYRQGTQIDVTESAEAMIADLAETPRRLWAVTTANVLREFHANRDPVNLELGAYIANLDRSVSRIVDVARTLFPERRISSLDWLDATLQNRAMSVMDRLVESLVVYCGSNECIGKARDRVWEGRRPASSAKQEFKDCEIFEEFLELALLVRGGNSIEPAIFVTTNKADYGDAPFGHHDIAADLRAATALYVSNLAWAMARIRNPKLDAG